MSSIIRSEAHSLKASVEVRSDVARTIAFYRRAVRALCGVLMVHWPEIANAKSKCQAVESLFHATAKRPKVRYGLLDRMLGKMPSYLRRAAIEHACGAVASFHANWSNFLDGQIGGKNRQQGCRSPRLGLPQVFPSLYGGNMILYGKGLEQVQIKLLQADGQWRFSQPLPLRGKFKRLLPLANRMDMSPSLMQRGAKNGSKVWLNCPVEVRPPRFITNKEFSQGSHRVCSVDVGINTAATAAIVDSSGTVIARKFLNCGRHNDQRDTLAQKIAAKQSATGRLVKGQRHCMALHQRIEGLSLDAARSLASGLAEFAAQHGAKVFVVEDLKGWRPKGPSKAMRRRFHRFQHRALIKALSHKAQEMGARMLEVYARGTSRWAYDGSGKVTRSRSNAQLATFASGKQYNADLNGALNIAARGLAILLGMKNETDQNAVPGKSSGAVERAPLVLANVWAYAKARLQRQLKLPHTSGETSNQQALPVGVYA